MDNLSSFLFAAELTRVKVPAILGYVLAVIHILVYGEVLDAYMDYRL